MVKIAAGGAAGLFVGAILGGVSMFVLAFKAAKKLLLPFK
jgi:hypothetical protein